MSHDTFDIINFLKADVYPFYFPTVDADGNLERGVVLLPREEFLRRGASDPREYYLNKLYA